MIIFMCEITVTWTLVCRLSIWKGEYWT